MPQSRSRVIGRSEPAPHEGEHVVPPMFLVFRGPLGERLFERAEPEEEVLRLLRDGRRSVDPALRVLQLERIQEIPAVLALVAASAGEAAVGARSLDVSIREEPLVRCAKGGDHHRLVDVAFLLECEEDFLHPRLVMRVRRVPVEIIADAELLDVLHVQRVVPLREDVRGHPFLVGSDRDRGAVHVASADHQDLVPFHPVVPRENIRGDERRDRMAEMSRTGRVRPSDADEDLRHSRRVQEGRLI